MTAVVAAGLGICSAGHRPWLWHNIACTLLVVLSFTRWRLLSL